MFKKKRIGIVTLFLFMGCSIPKPKNENQILDFGSFSIEVPRSWSKIEARGVDSYVGRIAIENGDTLDFDLGWYSNKLIEEEPQIVERSMLKNMPDADTTEFIIIESRKGIAPDKYRKNDISWDLIDRRKAKIVYPRQSGIGITGIYIDSLWQEGSANVRFNLYGTNLKPSNETALLRALKTLKFRPASFLTTEKIF
jgi:hypothetical protein